MLAVVIAGLTGCAGKNSHQPVAPGPVADASCVAPEAARDSVAAALGPLDDLSIESYWAHLSAGGDPAHPERLLAPLAADTRRFETAVAALAEIWSAYARCRPSELGDSVIEQVRRREVVLELAVGRLLDAYPRNKAQLARAAWVMPVPTHYYVAQMPTAIYTRPDAQAPHVAQLRKGVRVAAIETEGAGDDPHAGEGPAPDWIAIRLNDASRGYVPASALKSVPPNASALDQVARARAIRAGDGDPVTALALDVREHLPNTVTALADAIAAQRLKLASGEGTPALSDKP